MRLRQGNGVHSRRARRMVCQAAAQAVLCLVCATTALAQISRPPPPTICRSLTDGDRYFPAYKSCCDTDGGHSRWVKADGKTETRVSICALWGINPGPASLDLPASQRPVDPKMSTKGIPPGKYACAINFPAGSTVKLTIQRGGRFTTDEGSSASFELADRGSDGIGPFARYRITGGPFDGFFFLHRDSGQLQLGRNGWGRCLPE